MPSDNDLTPVDGPDVEIQREGLADLWHRSSRRDKALLGCILATGLVLTINLSITIFLACKHGVGQNLGDLYTRNCENMELINTVVHLLINVISSIVLAASNFCAQLLVAPTRDEVTCAHRKGDWLDLGVPSFRNLVRGRIATRRRLLWAVLALSSAPLHLLSVILVPNSFHSDGS